MKNVEIEKKYLVKKEDIISGYKKYKHVRIVQSFISLKPCIRIRRAGKKYYLTVKTKPNIKIKEKDLVRNEYEVIIDKQSYINLLKKCVGRVIEKERYFIPYKGHIIEMDIFMGDLKGLVYAEVEFNSIKEARSFIAPKWFYKDVTGIEKYKNTSLSNCKNLANVLKY